MITVDMKSLLNRLNPCCRKALEAAAGVCVSRTHYEVTVEHFLWQLLDEPLCDVSRILKQCGGGGDELRRTLDRTLEEFATGNGAKPVFSPRLMDWFQEAQLIGSVEMGEPQIRSGVLLLAFLNRPTQFSTVEIGDLLLRVNREELVKGFASFTKGSVEEVKGAPSGADPRPAGALSKYCEDFTAKARAGKIDPVFGRDTEIRQVVDIFARRRKNNPIVVGEAGVGKTAIVEGLALRIVEGDVPDFLKNVTLMSLDMGLLQAGAGVKGEFENRLKQVIEEVKASETPIILFIDEAHTMIGAGGSAGGSDAANLLKPALARGELRTVAATTWSEYKKYFEKDAALARRFQLVYLDEPSEDTATLILRGLKANYEKSHGVVIRDDAVKAAAELSARYISGRYLPDKAIDLLDTSAARVKVLLTAKPGPVEDIERQLQARAREKSALSRDGVYGSPVDTEQLEAVEAEINALETELTEVTARWAMEQGLAAELIDLRQQYWERSVAPEAEVATEVPATEVEETEAAHDSASLSAEPPHGDDVEDDPVVPLADEELRALIDDRSSELAAIQGTDPLVRTEVDPGIVSEVVSDWTGIPAGKVMHDEARTIIGMEEDLKARIKGQDEAIKGISQVIKASKAGLGDPEQPLGVFLLTGPSGVGKTETGLAVADLLFGGERSTISVNMSEFQEKHTVSRLIGSPPGYVGYGEGGILTEAVRQRPYSVVLLDEAEKANDEVMNLFYQVFDKGALSDGEGRRINFSNTVIFLTSNLASELISSAAEAGEIPDTEELIAAIRPALSQHFKPALLARMSIVPFLPLPADIMQEVVEIKLRKVANRLQETHNITLTVAPAVIGQIADRCVEVETGARNIDHIMNGTVLPLISRELLQRMSEGELPAEMTLDTDEAGAFVCVPSMG
ncbi:type VI secretion system ATPase TssH [Desulfoluna spongiiphila]|uniref:Type VI secretion system protein VasG n=1 Tax=Desulfoluna spongiiphila TaxID=419481 RepID=A0A1G5E1J7_9BACT|nr:type VI secretion system ATPase TssH [Desulfoluna spongiiphila]SCY20745.1 type VI secretion system protein VasG [Desulfoluna spongiiphila]